MIKFMHKMKKESLSSKTPEELDYEKNIKNLNRKLNVRIVGGVFGIILTLMILMTFITKKKMENSFYKNIERELVSIRNSKLNQIKNYYKGLSYEMESQLKNYLKYSKYDLLDSKRDFYLNMGIEDVILMDKNFSSLYHQNKSYDIQKIKKELKDIKFKDSFFIGNIDFDDEIPYQHLYYKIFKGSKEYYISFRLNNHYIENLLKDSDFKIDILNKDYYVVSSTSHENVNNIQIDDVTKKMLSGRTGIGKIDSYIYSYSFIDLDESVLYIKTYLDGDIYGNYINQYLKIIALIWIISISFGIIVSVFLKNSIDSYTQGRTRIELEKTGDQKYGFLKEEFIEAFENLDEVDESLYQISNFSKDIRLLKERLIKQNNELVNKMKNEKVFIDEVKENDSLRKKISEEIKNI